MRKVTDVAKFLVCWGQLSCPGSHIYIYKHVTGSSRRGRSMYWRNCTYLFLSLSSLTKCTLKKTNCVIYIYIYIYIIFIHTIILLLIDPRKIPLTYTHWWPVNNKSFLSIGATNGTSLSLDSWAVYTRTRSLTDTFLGCVSTGSRWVWENYLMTGQLTERGGLGKRGGINHTYEISFTNNFICLG